MAKLSSKKDNHLTILRKNSLQLYVCLPVGETENLFMWIGKLVK